MRNRIGYAWLGLFVALALSSPAWAQNAPPTHPAAAPAKKAAPAPVRDLNGSVAGAGA